MVAVKLIPASHLMGFHLESTKNQPKIIRDSALDFLPVFFLGEVLRETNPGTELG